MAVLWSSRRWYAVAFGISLFFLTACGSQSASPAITPAKATTVSVTPNVVDLLGAYSLLGDTQPVHDPSIMRQGSTYYLFTTDVLGLPSGNYLPMRCSQDEVHWSICGSVFPAIPAWVQAKVPGIVGLWAPDISYFNGLYHLYYAGSTLNSQNSVIGVATNTTLDTSDPGYKWVDLGEVLQSVSGDDFNAIDPNILVEADGSVWMTYGSYWSGLKQLQIDPASGKLFPNSKRYELATRPGVTNNPLEGASIVRHGGYYYLFASIDYCCNFDSATDNYKEEVGRSTSPQGPFLDMSGLSMMSGGGTIVLDANASWNAPGGGTAYVDAATGESLIVFHALKANQGSTPSVWLKHISWQNDWPVLL